MGTPNSKSLPPISAGPKDLIKKMKWSDFTTDLKDDCESLAAKAGYDTADESKFAKLLEVAARAYSRIRENDTLWKKCEGKQVLAAVAVPIGFSGPDTLIQAASAAWERDPALIPSEVTAVREFVGAL